MRDERLLKQEERTWKCDMGLKSSRDKKVITCPWIMLECLWRIKSNSVQLGAAASRPTNLGANFEDDHVHDARKIHASMTSERLKQRSSSKHEYMKA
ncbi:hypothetical protein GQ457_09G016000 [Hibiscus cannabinus]